MPFSIPSSNQASTTSSAGVNPVPSSRVEKRHVPMVLVSRAGAAVLRPSSSKGWRREVFKEPVRNVVKSSKQRENLWDNQLILLGNYLQGVVSLELPIRRRGRWCRRFVVTHGPGDKLLNTHDSVCPETLVQVGAQLKKKEEHICCSIISARKCVISIFFFMFGCGCYFQVTEGPSKHLRKP